jgi:hypothetical protein
MKKSEYYQIAARMQLDEIPPEVAEKLDILQSVLCSCEGQGQDH